MNVVKISPKYQVVIPKEAREVLHLSPGQNLQVIIYDNRIELVPEQKIAEMRGFIQGIDTSIERELGLWHR